ncbi:MAG: hypothetical protein PHH43_01850 [Candidatus Cloacimonetes bacterium]|nr:hypothetical protein [Candidatus Cloacimonadota bacterium]MDD3235050.1 hypothetical protein [Candidatus Cloacimonadota bacterium]
MNSFLRMLHHYEVLLLLLLLLLLTLLTGCWSYINKSSAQAFLNRKQLINVTVYPINIIKGSENINDKELARELVYFLQQESLADPLLGSSNHSYPFQWGHNQAAMAQRSAKAFAAQVRADNITTDYALLVEILCNQYENNVMGVGYYLVDKTGLAADGSLSNSDWQDFKDIKPTNRQGGIKVVENMLKRNWKNELGLKGGF